MTGACAAGARANGSRQLESERIRLVMETLGLRIQERFPAASLARVANDLQAIAAEHSGRIERIARPHLVLRGFVAVVVLVAAALMTLCGRSDRLLQNQRG